MFATCETMGLAEWIVGDTCLVLFPYDRYSGGNVLEEGEIYPSCTLLTLYIARTTRNGSTFT